MWWLPLVTGCADHGCRLEDTPALALAAAEGREGRKPMPVGEPLAALDRYTYQALTTGRVTLPGRSVHAGVWFRSLLDEV